MVNSITESEERYLNLNEVCALLPDFLKFDPAERLERSIYKTVEGKPIPVLNSKLYPQGYYWYSSITSYFKSIGAEYICFTAGNYGIIVLPIDIVLHYNKFSGWKGKGKRGRQYHVRIKHSKENELSFINYNRPEENINITEYLIKK